MHSASTCRGACGARLERAQAVVLQRRGKLTAGRLRQVLAKLGQVAEGDSSGVVLVGKADGRHANGRDVQVAKVALLLDRRPRTHAQRAVVCKRAREEVEHLKHTAALEVANERELRDRGEVDRPVLAGRLRARLEEGRIAELHHGCPASRARRFERGRVGKRVVGAHTAPRGAAGRVRRVLGRRGTGDPRCWRPPRLLYKRAAAFVRLWDRLWPIHWYPRGMHRRRRASRYLSAMTALVVLLTAGESWAPVALLPRPAHAPRAHLLRPAEPRMAFSMPGFGSQKSQEPEGPSEEVQGLFRMLGLPEDADYDEINAAYDALAAKYEGETKRLIKLAVAKDKILDYRLRQRMTGALKVSEVFGEDRYVAEKKPLVTLPPFLQGVMELPSKEELIKKAAGFACIGLLPALALSWASTSVSLGFAAALYLLYNRGAPDTGNDMEAAMRPPKVRAFCRHGGPRARAPARSLQILRVRPLCFTSVVRARC
eukprot:7024481-Prymnesium_polylepis.1